MTRSDY